MQQQGMSQILEVSSRHCNPSRLMDAGVAEVPPESSQSCVAAAIARPFKPRSR